MTQANFEMQTSTPDAEFEVRLANTAIKAEAQAKAKMVRRKVSEEIKSVKDFEERQISKAVNKVLTIGDQLADKHTDYVLQYVTKANEALYVLLSEIMAFAEQVLSDENSTQIINRMQSILKSDYKIKVQENTPPLTSIVRYITRTNRKNACIYGKVLKIAFENNITSTGLTKFIDENGGINKLREKTINANTVQKKNDQEAIHFYLERWFEEDAETKPLATFTIDKELQSELHDRTKGGRFAYMICERRGTEFKVIDAVAGMDKELEHDLWGRYFVYNRARIASTSGEGKASETFIKRMQATLAKQNAMRTKHGYPQLDIQLNEIENSSQSEVTESNVSDLDLDGIAA